MYSYEFFQEVFYRFQEDVSESVDPADFEVTDSNGLPWTTSNATRWDDNLILAQYPAFERTPPITAFPRPQPPTNTKSITGRSLRIPPGCPVTFH